MPTRILLQWGGKGEKWNLWMPANQPSVLCAREEYGDDNLLRVCK